MCGAKEKLEASYLSSRLAIFQLVLGGANPVLAVTSDLNQKRTKSESPSDFRSFERNFGANLYHKVKFFLNYPKLLRYPDLVPKVLKRHRDLNPKIIWGTRVSWKSVICSIFCKLEISSRYILQCFSLFSANFHSTLEEPMPGSVQISSFDISTDRH